MKLEFSRQIFEKSTNIIFIKIRPVGAELFHADRQTDGRTDGHDEADSRLSQFSNAPKNEGSKSVGLIWHVVLHGCRSNENTVQAQ